MHVCEKCHEIDADAIECNYTYNIHLSTQTATWEFCEICGKWLECIFCADYQAESMIRSRVRTKKAGV